jgi:Domain of unknown function (DUF3535)
MIMVSSSGTHHTPDMPAGCLASVAVASNLLPPKLNAIIQPLMGGLRKEAEPLLQTEFACALACMLQLAADRTPCPNDKWVMFPQHIELYVGCRLCRLPMVEALYVLQALRVVGLIVLESVQHFTLRNENRLVTNICNMACSDPAETPCASLPDAPLEAADVQETGLEPAPDAEPSDPVSEAAANARKVF